MNREDKRKNDELRKLKIVRPYLPYAEGSVYLEMGNTWIICTATVEDKVPSFLRGTGQGWITAEYGMLPRSSPTRIPREATLRRIGGRTQEIKRMIGRALRSVTDLHELGERTIYLDCDVVRADGGTRTAAITGSFIALYDALDYLVQTDQISSVPLNEYVAAISVGIVGDNSLLDLCYIEDSEADVDMNVVMSETGRIIEIQGTGEKRPFEKKELDNLLKLAKKGINKLIKKQKKVIGKELT